MPYYYTKEEELKALRQENADLKARLNKLEFATVNFAKLTYAELMKFFVKNFAEYSDDKRGMENAGLSELYDKWNIAYSVFKTKRNERADLIRLYLAKYFATKSSGSILFQNAVIEEIMPDIKKIYLDITPFDCEDRKWTDTYNYESWKQRINSFLSDYAYENSIYFHSERVAKVKQPKGFFICHCAGWVVRPWREFVKNLTSNL